jgi:hypothetical protein
MLQLSRKSIVFLHCLLRKTEAPKGRINLPSGAFLKSATAAPITMTS